MDPTHDKESSFEKESSHDVASLHDASSKRSQQLDTLKLDSRGLPLVPQPTDDPDDPLTWPSSAKMMILILISLQASFNAFNLAVGNPAFIVIAKYFHVSVVQAGYPAVIAVATVAIGPFLWVPLANVYGRRPVLLATSLVALATTIASATAKTYHGLIVARAFTGIFISSANALGVAIVNDLFFLHERGVKMGIFTVLLTNGPHLAPLPGGFLAQYVGWRWTLWLPAIINGTLLLAMLFLLPETLYIRSATANAGETGAKVTHHAADFKSSFRRRLGIWGFRNSERSLSFMTFATPFRMLTYPNVLLPAFYYGVVFTLGSVLPAITVSKLFSEFYGYKSARTGTVLFLSTFIGGMLGEIVAGPVIDRMMARRREAAGGKAKPETRLHGMWPGVILLPLGLIVFGLCIHNHKKVSIAGPAAGMGMTCFAVQIVTTPVYAYVADIYKAQAGESALVLNFMRQGMSWSTGFWAINFGEKVGFQWSGVTYALVTFFFFVPVLITMIWGEGMRRKRGEPSFNRGG